MKITLFDLCVQFSHFRIAISDPEQSIEINERADNQEEHNVVSSTKVKNTLLESIIS